MSEVFPPSSSSPPSSPNVDIDSSPPSSPRATPFDDDLSNERPGVEDPFAASTNSGKKRPRQYYRAHSPGSPSNPGRIKKRRLQPSSPNLSQDSGVFLCPDDQVSSQTSHNYDWDPEEVTWDDACADVVDKGDSNAVLDLVRHEPPITFIPKELPKNLNKLVGIPSRTQSDGPRTATLKMFLSGNAIAKLPKQLFELTNLTVLTLRNNKISYIPPGIHRLEALQELDISQNNIKFLPSEMLDMKLSNLRVNANDFIPPPSEAASGSRVMARTYSKPKQVIEKEVSEIISRDGNSSNVPILLELCLRALLLDCECAGDSSTTRPLIKNYETRPSELQAPLWLCNLFDIDNTIASRFTPSNINKPVPLSPNFLSPLPEESGVCPSTNHSEKHSHFFFHEEERLTWESKIGNCSPGGTVPVLWRGCSKGCLEFLDSNRRKAVPPVVPFTADAQSNGGADEGVVEIVEITQGLGDNFNDFD